MGEAPPAPPTPHSSGEGLIRDDGVGAMFAETLPIPGKVKGRGKTLAEKAQPNEMAPGDFFGGRSHEG
jgi:hypothetical protein